MSCSAVTYLECTRSLPVVAERASARAESLAIRTWLCQDLVIDAAAQSAASAATADEAHGLPVERLNLLVAHHQHDGGTVAPGSRGTSAIQLRLQTPA